MVLMNQYRYKYNLLMFKYIFLLVSKSGLTNRKNSLLFIAV